MRRIVDGECKKVVDEFGEMFVLFRLKLNLCEDQR
jgi:hypothetical protein